MHNLATRPEDDAKKKGNFSSSSDDAREVVFITHAP